MMPQINRTLEMQTLRGDDLAVMHAQRLVDGDEIRERRLVLLEQPAELLHERAAGGGRDGAPGEERVVGATDRRGDVGAHGEVARAERIGEA